MKKLILITALFTALLLTSCSGFGGYGSVELNGTNWKLVSYGGKLPLEGKTMTANFEGKEISGSASCNHYSGVYKIKGSQISVEGLGWTEMACLDPEGIMEQETMFLAWLQDAQTFEIRKDQLMIFRSDGEALTFVPESK